MTYAPPVGEAEIDSWIERTLARERWFVEPAPHVPKADESVAVACLSPLAYNFAMMSLGLMAIYHRINRDPHCPAIADRVFLYEPLAEDGMHPRPHLSLGTPLATMERRLPLHGMDLICVSLTTADAITGVLELLHLGGVPLRCRDREPGRHPLILMGGPGCVNPEPFAEYIDIFCMGDGLEATAAVVSAIHGLTTVGKAPDAVSVAAATAGVPGLYLPAAPIGDGRVPWAEDAPTDAAIGSLVTDGETAVIVPNRGCRQICFYCGIGSQSYREVPLDSLLSHVRRFVDAGIRTIIVNSPTITQYSQAVELMNGIAGLIEGSPNPPSVYIGSVKFDEMRRPLLEAMDRLGPFSHTYMRYTDGKPGRCIALAPEHSNGALLRRFGRNADPSMLLGTVALAQDYDIHSFVLYFVVGFPTETDDDMDAIASLIAEVMDRVHLHGGRVVAKINPLIPTPNTACQRLAMPSMATYHRLAERIEQGVRHRVGAPRMAAQFELVLLPTDRLLAEAILTRGGREVAPVVERIWRARRSGVAPHEDDWRRWAQDDGLDLDAITGTRPLDQPVPWHAVDNTPETRERRLHAFLAKEDPK